MGKKGKPQKKKRKTFAFFIPSSWSWREPLLSLHAMEQPPSKTVFISLIVTLYVSQVNCVYEPAKKQASGRGRGTYLMTKMERKQFFIYESKRQTSTKLLKRQQERKKWHSLISHCSLAMFYVGTWRRLENVMRIRNGENKTQTTASTTALFDGRGASEEELKKYFRRIYETFNFCNLSYIDLPQVFFTSYEGRRQQLFHSVGRRPPTHTNDF